MITEPDKATWEIGAQIPNPAQAKLSSSVPIIRLGRSESRLPPHHLVESKLQMPLNIPLELVELSSEVCL